MQGIDMVRMLYDQFKELHPNSRDEFVPSEANIHRWRWHLAHAQYGVMPREALKADINLQHYIEQTRVSSLEQMPLYMQERFREISNMIPGREVYACGSRVRGGYVEEWTPDHIRAMVYFNRSPKKESDYDVWVKGVSNDDLKRIKKSLPEYADVLLYVPENEKILIPKMIWDFSKLPDHEHARVLDLWQKNDVVALAAIHNQYRLSDHNYCCKLSGVSAWFKYGIETGQIQANDQTNTADSMASNEHRG